jgi:hypothetical protein
VEEEEEEGLEDDEDLEDSMLDEDVRIEDNNYWAMI